METYRSLGPGDDDDSDAGTHICGRHKGDDDDSDFPLHVDPEFMSSNVIAYVKSL